MHYFTLLIYLLYLLSKHTMNMDVDMKKTDEEDEKMEISNNNAAENNDINMDGRLWKWIGLSRKLFETYSITDYSQIDESALFSDYKTLKDVKDNKDYIQSLLRSPTGCFISVDEDSGKFYCDQQGCVIWFFEKETGYVKTQPDSTGISCYVAKSIPEFFSHVYMESLEFFSSKSWIKI